MVHSRFFNCADAAQIGSAETKDELNKILALIPLEDEAGENLEIAKAAIADFVQRCE